ncbi:CRISPR-associated endonuclease Cas3'' [Enemella evansiae]|uniref:CRISPR-associated endonuclease Cas3'' n=1 Tax=Enemella evansiae TaxID=2016499 RepID=UPI000B964A1C|nr:CRISPR-associated endonuclease Cas3'' [Enemella evansiae]
MLDSAAVAERLFDLWLAPSVRRLWGGAFPGGEEDARAVFVFLAGAHDVGKASPVFVAQVESLAARVRLAGLECPSMDELRDDRRVLPHATVSCLALEDWFAELGVDPDFTEQLASVVGAHHGRPAQGSFREFRLGRVQPQ